MAIFLLIILEDNILSKIDVNDIVWITSVLLSTKLPFSSLYDILCINYRIAEEKGFRWLGLKLKLIEEKKKKSTIKTRNESINKIITNNSNSKSSLFFLLISRATIELEMSLRYLITVIINDLENNRENSKNNNNIREETKKDDSTQKDTNKTLTPTDIVTREERVKMILLTIPLLQSAFEYVLEQIGEEEDEGIILQMD
jgi:hypothetical protein